MDPFWERGCGLVWCLATSVVIGIVNVNVNVNGANINGHGGGSGRTYHGVPSMKSAMDPTPCRPNILREQVNYICSNEQIWCLPGWKVRKMKGAVHLSLSSFLLDNPVRMQTHAAFVKGKH